MSEPSQVGRYRILGVLRQGEMATLYRGRDELLDHDVTIKTLSPVRVDDPELRAHFMREAKVVARLTHPNIARVLDLGEHEGVLYMTFEPLDGMTLRQAIEAGINLKVSLPVVVQVLDGLAYVHQQGVVHRDIKPASIFIQADGSVKITDFWLARLTAASTTSTGNIVGTPDYMSGEQVKGSKVDGRSDLFSVGCVLYELVAGRTPFHSDDLMGMFWKITHEAPDMGLIPEGRQWERLRTVITRALQKDPEDRYPDARAMSTDLLQALKELGESADRKTPRPPA